jgi:hypothetical protein
MEHQSPTLKDANGFPIATRSLLLQVTANDSLYLDFTDLDTRFPRYVIEGDGIYTNVDKVELNALFSIGGVFKEGEDDYTWAARSFASNASSSQNQKQEDARMSTNLTGTGDQWSNVIGQTGDVTFTITRGGSNNPPRIWGNTSFIGDGDDLVYTINVGTYTGVTSGAVSSAGIDGVRLIFTDAGRISAGNFRLYGVE